MTRRQALQKVLEYLDSQQNLDETLCTAKIILREMRNGIPGKIWDDAAIRQAIERFLQEEGRPPIVKELDTVGYLPSHTCVQRQYGMTAGHWLHQNYPFGENDSWKLRCAAWGGEDVKTLFIQEYNRMTPVSSLAYNRGRTPGTPTWQSIAKMLSVRTWRELKALCGVSPRQRRKGEFEGEVSATILPSP